KGDHVDLFISLLYDEPGSPPAALSRTIEFSVADTKGGSVMQIILELVTDIIPGPNDMNQSLELRGPFQLSLIMDKAAELFMNGSLEEATKYEGLYLSLLRFVRKLAAHPTLKRLVQESRHPKQQTPGLQVLSQRSNIDAQGQSAILTLGDESISSLDER